MVRAEPDAKRGQPISVATSIMLLAIKKKTNKQALCIKKRNYSLGPSRASRCIRRASRNLSPFDLPTRTGCRLGCSIWTCATQLCLLYGMLHMGNRPGTLLNRYWVFFFLNPRLYSSFLGIRVFLQPGHHQAALVDTVLRLHIQMPRV